MIEEIEGEAAAPPPAADYSAAPTPPVRKPWPVLLAQALRTGHFINAQIALVGAVECKVPDPATVLTIGGRWQVTHRDLRAARAGLSPAQQDLVRRYAQRDDELRERRDESGKTFYEPVPPPMRDGEPEAFGALWSLLHQAQALTRLPPRPQPPTESNTDQ